MWLIDWLAIQISRLVYTWVRHWLKMGSAYCLLYQVFHLDLFQNNDDRTWKCAIQKILIIDILKSLGQLFSTGVIGCYTSITIKNYNSHPVLHFCVVLISSELIANEEKINLIFYFTNHITMWPYSGWVFSGGAHGWGLQKGLPL